MRRTIILITILTINLLMGLPPPVTLPQKKPPTIEVYFSPNGGCTEDIIKELDRVSQKGMKE